MTLSSLLCTTWVLGKTSLWWEPDLQQQVAPSSRGSTPQYFGHLMRRADSFEKTPMLGKIKQEETGTTEDEMVGWHH